jgi:hypothetical protein
MTKFLDHWDLNYFKDPDPSINMQKNFLNLDFHSFVFFS